MRRLGTLGDAEAARRFTESLRTRGIGAEARPEAGGGSSVWILDEDRLHEARSEWSAFERDPTAPRFQVAPKPAPVRQTETLEPMPVPRRRLWRRVPVTLSLIVASVVATGWTNFGLRGEAFAKLAISSEILEGDWPLADHLSDIRHGQIWRLFTPALMHGDAIHLLGNLAALWVLGGAVESTRGSLRMLLFVLGTAAISNFAEYWLDFGLTFDAQNGLRANTGIRPDPRFLGMSGVVFGLFGFIWMRARFVPGSRFVMPRDMVVWMLIWLLACTAGLVGAIANVAHLTGLLAGMLVGVAPRLWLRRSPDGPGV